jgi:hypothetical protein
VSRTLVSASFRLLQILGALDVGSLILLVSQEAFDPTLNQIETLPTVYTLFRQFEPLVIDVSGVVQHSRPNGAVIYNHGPEVSFNIHKVFFFRFVALLGFDLFELNHTFA